MMSSDVIKPDVTPAQARDLAARLFGVSAAEAKELNSYDDRNFIVSDGAGARFVLKVSNIMESDDRGRLAFQNEVMQRLAAAGLPVQLPQASVHGRTIERERLLTRLTTDGATGEREHAVRLLSFLPGIPLDDPRVRVDARLIRDAARVVAQVSRTLSATTLDGPVPSCDFLWSLMALPRLREFAWAVKDERQRQLVFTAVERFEKEVLPVADSLTAGVIYGDPNEQNILVRERQPVTSPSSFEIAGLLDWQDSHKAPVVFDLALFCMYLMSSFKPSWDPGLDEFSLPRHCVDGFATVWPLSALERRLLPIMVIARFAQSLCMGAYSYDLDPDNEYLLTTAINGWRQLEVLCAKDPEELARAWAGQEEVVNNTGNEHVEITNCQN